MERSLISFALESAIGAELALFTAFLLSGQRRSSALYLLAGLAACMTVLTVGNLMASQTHWLWLDDAILGFDLLAPPLVFLYVTQMRRDPKPLARADALHVLPAIAGIAIWKSQIFWSMDFYVNAVWLGYLAATAIYLARNYAGYVPRQRQRFLMLLLGLLFAILALRLVLVWQAAALPSFRDGLAYLLILGGLFIATCLILFTALSHPDLLSVPGSHVKYNLSAEDERGLDRLNGKLVALLEKRKPYLDPDFSLSELAAMLGAPQRTISQLVNARHGMNVAAYLNFLRVTAASNLLSTTDKPVKSIMFEAGFRSKSIFNREFQRCFGSSPTDYRRVKRPAAE